MSADTAALADAVVAGDRRALGRAITLVESARADHRERAARLLNALLPHTGGATRVGITGAPGSGKSTFIEALGPNVIAQGHRVAVLAVDPSSAQSGGSILGDKTRMEQLARESSAFIRPSPSGTSAGGVARRTREALLVCEAAGFDVVLVETVGVGQSEVAVADLVDVFVLLAAPGGGDDLQGIKRGVMELADVVVVTKADGDLTGPAQQAASDYRIALHLMPPKFDGWTPPVLLASATRGEGIDDVWSAVARLRAQLESTGALDTLRGDQAVAWLWAEVRDRVLQKFYDDPGVAARARELEADVRSGRTSAGAAADALLSNSRQ